MNVPLTRTTVSKHISHLVFFSDLHSARFLLFLAEFFWCISLAWPGVTFDRPTYTIMAKIGPEEAWATVFGLSAFIQIYLILIQNYFSKAAQIFSAWNAFFWSFVVISMYNSVTPPPAAISGELALSIAAAWVFVRSGYKTRT